MIPFPHPAEQAAYCLEAFGGDPVAAIDQASENFRDAAKDKKRFWADVILILVGGGEPC